MPTKALTEISISSPSAIRLFKWAGMQNGDDGTPLYLPKHSDKSIQVKGTFGAGGNCRIEGSNMDSSFTWATLNDPQGNPLDITTAKIEAILENTYVLRPRITAGDGTTALDVYILVKE